MVKVKLFYFVIAFFVAFTALVSSSDYITGEVITGRVSFDGTGVYVYLQGSPALTIIYPENKTYLRKSILINYSASGSSNVTYSIDGAANVSLTGAEVVNFTNGGTRHLELYADNGETSSEILYLTVNTSKLRIYYSNFNGSTKGASMDFDSYAYEDLLNISSVVLENTDYGKVEFEGNINIKEDIDNDTQVDFDSNVIFAQNSLRINSQILPNFNRSANISFYNVAITTPQILIDDVVCPATICTQRFYGGGTYIFSVNRFSKFSLREYDEDEEEESSSSGGGGGSATAEDEVALEIILPDVIQMATEDSIVIPVIFRNDEENMIMRGIDLKAVTGGRGIFPTFEDVIITELRPGEEQEVSLFIDTKDAEIGSYVVDVIANGRSPPFEVRESLFLETTKGLTKVKVEERIILAQEFFRNNPECTHLNKELDRATELFNAGDVSESQVIVQEAILRCREIIAQKEYPASSPQEYFLNYSWIIIGVLVIILLLLVLLKTFRKPKSLRKSK